MWLTFVTGGGRSIRSSRQKRLAVKKKLKGLKENIKVAGMVGHVAKVARGDIEKN